MKGRLDPPLAKKKKYPFPSLGSVRIEISAEGVSIFQKIAHTSMTTSFRQVFLQYFGSIMAASLLLCVISSCEPKFGAKGRVWKSTEYKELTTAQNPDDPDLEICDSAYYFGHFSHSAIWFVQEDDKMDLFTIKLIPNNKDSDTIVISHVNLDEWIPTVPYYLRKDSTLAKIAIFNQQFNRVQAKFEVKKDDLTFASRNEESGVITRLDLAKNCLHLPLWEIIAFHKLQDEKGETWDAPVYHAWFNFPFELHTKLMKRCGWSAEEARKYTAALSTWGGLEPTDAKSSIKLENLRVVMDEESLPVSILNDATYPMGEYDERFKKFKNVIYPRETTLISAYLNDSAEFASFQDPGVYNKSIPWKTELGRFKNPHHEAKVKRTVSKNKKKSECVEIELEFYRAENKREMTRLIFGGIDISKLDTLLYEDANKAKTQMPMGIANHSFTQSYKELSKPGNESADSPCYAMLLDRNDKWLNSHFKGIDGIMLHFGKKKAMDSDGPEVLHIWLLSFERHALVGHFAIAHDWEKYRKTAAK